MKNVQLGIIGTGGLAANVHLPALLEIPSATVAAVCDVNRSKAEAAAAKFAVPAVYDNYGEMLKAEELDGVFVLTEPDRLYRIAMDCLAAGLGVFMEKPPGITLYQAESIERESKRTGRPVQVGFNRRFIPVVVEALGILREHTEITHVEGRFYKHGEAAFYGGCASAFECDLIHCIDFIRFVAGGVPTRGTLLEARRNDIVPNVWLGTMEFDNGVTGTVRGHYATGGRVHQLEAHGPGGSAYINLGYGDDSCGADLILHDGQGSFSLASRGAGKQTRMVIDGKKAAGSDAFYRYYGFHAEDEAFVGSLAAGSEPICPISEGVKTMRLAEFLYSRRIGTLPC